MTIQILNRGKGKKKLCEKLKTQNCVTHRMKSDSLTCEQNSSSSSAKYSEDWKTVSGMEI